MIENVGHWITITLTSGLRKEGYFYAMDPDKKSIILFNQDQAIVIFGHAIKEYQFDKEKKMDRVELENKIHCSTNQIPTKEQLKERKMGLIQYFEKHRVPITYSNNDPVIQVLESARVLPPYVITSIESDNIILRKRVRDLIIYYDDDQA
ncbi:hypothetical protein BJ944DRAFT_238067 [Cunninghamella echinulata]|nr:hypothetical protein BJ944DRAFT_238067 [Cunninghamella echinulata]